LLLLFLLLLLMLLLLLFCCCCCCYCRCCCCSCCCCCCWCCCCRCCCYFCCCRLVVFAFGGDIVAGVCRRYCYCLLFEMVIIIIIIYIYIYFVVLMVVLYACPFWLCVDIDRDVAFVVSYCSLFLLVLITQEKINGLSKKSEVVICRASKSPLESPVQVRNEIGTAGLPRSQHLSLNF